MKRVRNTLIAFVFFAAVNAVGQVPEKFISSKTHITFFSTTPVEDIEANNYASVSTLKTKSGELVFSVPMQSFEFEKALMQEHFNNEHFLETNIYPKSKLKGKITNLDDVDFTQDGVYKATFEGVLTIKEFSKPIKEMGSVQVKGDVLIISAVFDITLADFGITFDEAEMVSTKVGKTVEIRVTAEYVASK